VCAKAGVVAPARHRGGCSPPRAACLRVGGQVLAEGLPDLRRAIALIAEDPLALVAPGGDVVERARELHSQRSSHTTTVPAWLKSYQFSG